jgi:hypothetical protein
LRSQFRLNMATSLGEKIATQSGAGSLPICPIAIAENHGIVVEAKPHSGGVSGVFQLVGNSAFILYVSRPSNQGFERFSIAHELGHYFLPGHPEEILSGGGTHISRANFTRGADSIEIEADHFAAGLLMPRKLVRPLLSMRPRGLAAAIAVGREAGTSLTAAAIRTAECADYPVCVVMSKGATVAYAFASTPFKRLGSGVFLRKGSSLPTTCETRRFNSDSSNIQNAASVAAATSLNEWFDNGISTLLDEEIIGLGAYGYTLTVLSSDTLPEIPDGWDEEETDLERSWTPRFAYGR